MLLCNQVCVSLSLLPLLYRGLVHEELLPRLQSTRVLNDWHRKLVKLASAHLHGGLRLGACVPDPKEGDQHACGKVNLGGLHNEPCSGLRLNQTLGLVLLGGAALHNQTIRVEFEVTLLETFLGEDFRIRAVLKITITELVPGLS